MKKAILDKTNLFTTRNVLKYGLNVVNTKKKNMKDNSEKTSEEIIKELKIIAFSNISDYVTWDESGQPKLRNDIAPEKMVAVKNLSVTENRMTIEMHDKTEALAKLSDYLLGEEIQP